MSLSPDQQDYVDDLRKRKRIDTCPCGWYSEEECLRHCATGTRTSAPDLVRRIREIYGQIDRANETST